MDNEKQEQAERGKRLKMLRTMTGKNQVEFAELCNVSGISINLWENGTYNGLSKKGAQRVVDALNKNGVICTLSWLWLGMGQSPWFATKHESIEYRSPNNHFLNDQIIAIKKETDLFLRLFTHSVVLEINDDSMLDYQRGDFIGALWSSACASTFLNKDMVVLLEDRKILIRRIGYDEEKKDYFLYASNTKSTSSDLFLANALIKKIAPIARIWRVVE